MGPISFHEWYAGAGASTHRSIADEAFRNAVQRFCSEMTKDGRKISLAEDAATLKDLEDLLATSMRDHGTASNWPKARSRLQEVAATIKHYSGVLDALAQHHPEYVALAWGSMKLLLVAFLNHEETTVILADALVSIARAMPRVELSAALYPTSLMKEAVVELYVHLIRFFIRAHDWYREGKWRRVLHSITRPPELRHKDLLQKIQGCSQGIEKLSVSAGQAELRDLSGEVRCIRSKADVLVSGVKAMQDTQEIGQEVFRSQLTTVISKLGTLDSAFNDHKRDMLAAQALHSSALLDTNRMLSDLQIGQILASLETKTLGDQLRTFDYYRSVRRKLAAAPPPTNQFWTSPRLKSWSHSAGSDIALLKASYQARFSARDFAVEVIQQLRTNDVPVIWALKDPAGANSQSRLISPVELLRHLVLQSLRLNQSLRAERMMAVSCARVATACTEVEWFRVLEASLDGLRQPIYLLIDLDALDHRPLADSGFSLWEEFMSYFDSLSARGSRARVKVLLTGCAPTPASQEIMDKTILVRTVGGAQKRALRRRRFRPAGIPRV